MLEGLCGNKNIEKVLLFLFVNNKCYGTQLQRALRTPLTSLQNAIGRLEKNRIIVSYFEGRTKIYHLNPAFPLFFELEQLLKKAYTLLSPQEKKEYSFVQQTSYEHSFQEPALFSFWKKLKTVKQFTRHTQSKDENGWNGRGLGEVLVTTPNENMIVFHERGSWQIQGQDMNFSNTFRWTLDRKAALIALEHLRLGPEHPVFLFYLTPTTKHLLVSVDSHHCEQDVYLATLPWDQYSIRLNWRVIGPKKNEKMECTYT